ncbi:MULTISPECIES: hypothetical protein [Fusobacterium]|uniref:Uncharacterized protein n=2 Tax=Fusobacterium varium TaxID=856 RepID=A0ABN5JIF9_FUSVA|nr:MULTISPECIES: hypothetical protein [Fusobacterium]AVQ30723.1 hypothetical protein C4N18_05660 [Fusobacterium varium ATCC 27725]EES64148.2 hypothetical protein FVAG_02730 [Fusobacterium varium ATCC 27725]MCF0171158.1 hypothetical protein [Fusobacterium varium]MCI6031998.1 hypothetical protein [Fusobacterium varium]MDY4006116.1 hypothetical protein [Fusobacterium varium]
MIKKIMYFLLISLNIYSVEIGQTSAVIKITGKVVANASLVVKVDGVETNEIVMENYIKGSDKKSMKTLTFELREEYTDGSINLKDVVYNGNEKNFYKIEKVSNGEEKKFRISYNTETLNKLNHGDEVEDTIVFTATYD